MTPAVLAELHASAFDRPWNAEAFKSLCEQPGVAALGGPDGFILVRTVIDEAEILTVAVRPAARRKGLGSTLVRAGAEAARRAGAVVLHLEVHQDNDAAIGLYRSEGFVESGRRPGYYPRTDGSAADALLFVLNLAD